MKNLVAIYHELMMEFKEDEEREKREAQISYESDAEYGDYDYDECWDHYFGDLDPEEQYWEDVENGLFDDYDWQEMEEDWDQEEKEWEDFYQELSNNFEYWDWEID